MNVGFYGLSQLYSCVETERQKARNGVFPWSRSKILRMVKEGTFPQPIRNAGRQNLWAKDEIDAFCARIKEGT